MKPTEFFNHLHPLHQVTRQASLEVSYRRPKYASIDLRFLTLISFGDTFDGRNNPAEGLSYRAVLYGNRVMCEKRKRYFDGKRMGPGETCGNVYYFKLYRMSYAYKAILSIAHKKYFGEKLPETCGPDQLPADQIIMDPGTARSLRRHPQFKELVRDLGLQVKHVRNLPRYTVSVTKFHRK